MEQTVRPTKKQRELLVFIEDFIAQNGYSPTYREIMAGCGYASVATVALHVNSLIKRGHLLKRDYSARSLEVVQPSVKEPLKSNQIKPTEHKWLVGKVDYFLSEAERLPALSARQAADLGILVEALSLLGGEQAATGFRTRLNRLKLKPSVPETVV